MIASFTYLLAATAHRQVSPPRTPEQKIMDLIQEGIDAEARFSEEIDMLRK